jgi:hypothetical protein
MLVTSQGTRQAREYVMRDILGIRTRLYDSMSQAEGVACKSEVELTERFRATGNNLMYQSWKVLLRELRV